MPNSELIGGFATGPEEATGEAAAAGVSGDDATGCCAGVGDGLAVSEGDAAGFVVWVAIGVSVGIGVGLGVSLSLGEGSSLTVADGSMAGGVVSTPGDSVTGGVSDAAGGEVGASGVASGVASMVVVATADGVGVAEGVAVEGLAEGVDTGWSADASGVGVVFPTGEGVSVGEGVSATEAWAWLEGEGSAATDGCGVGVVVSTGLRVAADEGVTATDGDGSTVVEASAFDSVAAAEGEFCGDSAPTAGAAATAAWDDAGEASVVAAATGAAGRTLLVRRSGEALVAGIVISFIAGRDW
jgi:hypothetical protein